MYLKNFNISIACSFYCFLLFKHLLKSSKKFVSSLVIGFTICMALPFGFKVNVRWAHGGNNFLSLSWSLQSFLQTRKLILWRRYVLSPVLVSYLVFLSINVRVYKSAKINKSFKAMSHVCLVVYLPVDLPLKYWSPFVSMKS